MASTPAEKHHRDGSLWARGFEDDGELDGYWEWFRTDGTLMRTGFFAHGVQTGDWTTYDRTGRVVKVSQL